MHSARYQPEAQARVTPSEVLACASGWCVAMNTPGQPFPPSPPRALPPQTGENRPPNRPEVGVGSADGGREFTACRPAGKLRQPLAMTPWPAAHGRKSFSAERPRRRGGRGAALLPSCGGGRRLAGFGDNAFRAILDGERLPRDALDRLQIRSLVAAAERDGDSGCPGPARAADAMNIVVRVGRQIEVHDVRDVVDVQSRGRRCRLPREPTAAVP